MPPADPINQQIDPATAAKMAELGWISPQTAAAFGAPPAAAAGAVPVSAGPGAGPMVLPPGSNIPLVSGVTSGAPGTVTVPGTGNAHSTTYGGVGNLPPPTPPVPGAGNLPPPMVGPMKRMIAADSQQTAADLANPQAPAGALASDKPPGGPFALNPNGTAHVPQMYRDAQGVLHPGAAPPKPAGGGGGGGAAAPAGPKVPTATEQWIADLQQQQRDISTRGVLLNDAIQKKAEAEGAKSIAIQAGSFEATQQAKDRLAQEASARQQAMKDADTADEASKARIAQVAAMKVDPNRIWHQANVPQKILGALAMAFGAFGATIGHTPNFAMQMIESATNRDVQAQVHDIQNAKDSNAELDKLSKQKYGRSMDMQEFMAHQRLDSYNYAMAQVDATSKSYDTDIAQANADILKQQLQGEISKEKLNIAQNIYSTNRQEELRKQAAASAGAGASYAAQKRNQDEFRKLVQDNMKNGDDLKTAQARALAVMAPQLQQGNLPSFAGKPAHGTGNQQEIDAARRSVAGAVARLKQLNEDAGVGGLWDPEKRAEAAALRAQIATQLPLAEEGSKRPGHLGPENQARIPDLNTPGSGAGRGAALDVLGQGMQGPGQVQQQDNSDTGFNPTPQQ